MLLFYLALQHLKLHWHIIILFHSVLVGFESSGLCQFHELQGVHHSLCRKDCENCHYFILKCVNSPVSVSHTEL